MPLKKVSKHKLRSVSVNWAVCSQNQQLINNLASMGVKHHQLNLANRYRGISQEADNILIDESYVKQVWGANWQQSISVATNNYILVASPKRPFYRQIATVMFYLQSHYIQIHLRELINSVILTMMRVAFLYRVFRFTDKY